MAAAYLTHTKTITITTPIPSTLSACSVKSAVQNHTFMLNLSPIVTSHTPLSTSSSEIPTNEPDFATAQWYKVSETVPVIGNINFLAAFRNTNVGMESVVHAPAGLRMRITYFVEGGEGIGARFDGDVAGSATAPRGAGGNVGERDGPADAADQAEAATASAADEATQGSSSSEMDASAAQRAKDWAFLGSHGHQSVLKEECTIQANLFLMLFITFSFESVHRRMQAQLFEKLAAGEGPEESS